MKLTIRRLRKIMKLKRQNLVNLMKINHYETDKDFAYLQNYEKFFRPLKNQKIKLLELGVFQGGSLLLWRDYFRKGILVGLDIEPVKVDDSSGKIKIYQGLQQDCVLLDQIRHQCAPDGFNIIIDDTSHLGELTQTSFWHLFINHLKPGGIYVIEDWGTGYWDSWPDGHHYETIQNSIKQTIENKVNDYQEPKKAFHSHTYGMVGFIKTLIDEIGMADITKPGLGIEPFQDSAISSVHIYFGQVFIIKNKM